MFVYVHGHASVVVYTQRSVLSFHQGVLRDWTQVIRLAHKHLLPIEPSQQPTIFILKHHFIQSSLAKSLLVFSYLECPGWSRGQWVSNPGLYNEHTVCRWLALSHSFKIAGIPACVVCRSLRSSFHRGTLHTVCSLACSRDFILPSTGSLLGALLTYWEERLRDEWSCGPGKLAEHSCYALQLGNSVFSLTLIFAQGENSDLVLNNTFWSKQLDAHCWF